MHCGVSRVGSSAHLFRAIPDRWFRCSASAFSVASTNHNLTDRPIDVLLVLLVLFLLLVLLVLDENHRCSQWPQVTRRRLRARRCCRRHVTSASPMPTPKPYPLCHEHIPTTSWCRGDQVQTAPACLMPYDTIKRRLHLNAL